MDEEFKCKDCYYGIDGGCVSYLECYYMPPTARKENGAGTYRGNDVRPMVHRNSHICGKFQKE